MSSTNPRVRKIADRIQVIVAEMLERRIKDPRLGFVTVTDVRVSGDTQHATVFYTVLGEEDQLPASAAALESAKGLIRSEVGKQLGIRHVPTLEFFRDALPENARHLEDLLEQVRDRYPLSLHGVGLSLGGEAPRQRQIGHALHRIGDGGAEVVTGDFEGFTGTEPGNLLCVVAHGDGSCRYCRGPKWSWDKQHSSRNEASKTANHRQFSRRGDS